MRQKTIEESPQEASGARVGDSHSMCFTPDSTTRAGATPFHCQFCLWVGSLWWTPGNRPSSLRHPSLEAAGPLRCWTGLRTGAWERSDRLLVHSGGFGTGTWRHQRIAPLAPKRNVRRLRLTGPRDGVPSPSTRRDAAGLQRDTVGASGGVIACSTDCGWSLVIAGVQRATAVCRASVLLSWVPTEAGATPAVHLRGPAPPATPSSQPVSTRLARTGSRSATEVAVRALLEVFNHWRSLCQRRPSAYSGLDPRAFLHGRADPYQDTTAMTSPPNNICTQGHRAGRSEVSAQEGEVRPSRLSERFPLTHASDCEHNLFHEPVWRILWGRLKTSCDCLHHLRKQDETVTATRIHPDARRTEIIVWIAKYTGGAVERLQLIVSVGQHCIVHPTTGEPHQHAARMRAPNWTPACTGTLGTSGHFQSGQLSTRPSRLKPHTCNKYTRKTKFLTRRSWNNVVRWKCWTFLIASHRIRQT